MKKENFQSESNLKFIVRSYFFLLKYSFAHLFICAFSQDLSDFVSSKTKQTKTGADKMAQKVKTLMTKPDDLSFIPGSHTIEEGNQ